MVLTQKELKKAAKLLGQAKGAKGLADKLLKASESQDPIKVKIPRKPVTVNVEQGLYVIPWYEGARLNGYSCLGFDVAIERAQGYYAWLKSEGQDVEPPDVSLRGTLEGYYDYRRLLDRASAYNSRTGKKCLSELSPQLVGLEGKRVEVVTIYDETRRFQVGKSTGWCPCHLEVANRASSGGAAAEKRYKSVRLV